MALGAVGGGGAARCRRIGALAAARLDRAGGSADRSALACRPVHARRADRHPRPAGLARRVAGAGPRAAHLLLWAAIVLLALTHYTHLPLLLAAAAAALVGTARRRARLAAGLRRLLPALAAAGAGPARWIVANGAALGRWTVSPTGSVFLYAPAQRGRADRPLARPALRPRRAAAPVRDPRPNCRATARNSCGPAPARRSPSLIWHPDPPEARWPWVDMMSQANRGAIAERPGAFLLSSLRGFARQLASFAPLDDECPSQLPRSERRHHLHRSAVYRPETVPVLLASHQSQGTTPKALVRAVVLPIAILALLLLPIACVLAWRRRDGAALSLVAAVDRRLARQCGAGGRAVRRPRPLSEPAGLARALRAADDRAGAGAA